MVSKAVIKAGLGLRVKLTLGKREVQGKQRIEQRV